MRGNCASRTGTSSFDADAFADSLPGWDPEARAAFLASLDDDEAPEGSEAVVGELVRAGFALGDVGEALASVNGDAPAALDVLQVRVCLDGLDQPDPQLSLQ